MIRGNRYPDLQVVITHALHVGCHHLLGLPVRLNDMHRTQFDHMRLDILSLCNLFTRVDYLSRETYAKYTQHSDEVKLF